MLLLCQLLYSVFNLSSLVYESLIIGIQEGEVSICSPDLFAKLYSKLYFSFFQILLECTSSSKTYFFILVLILTCLSTDYLIRSVIGLGLFVFISVSAWDSSELSSQCLLSSLLPESSDELSLMVLLFENLRSNLDSLSLKLASIELESLIKFRSLSRSSYDQNLSKLFSNILLLFRHGKSLQ